MVCGGVLAGLTSWGQSGCITASPSVYTRVTNYLTWIGQQTGITIPDPEIYRIFEIKPSDL